METKPNEILAYAMLLLPAWLAVIAVFILSPLVLAGIAIWYFFLR